MKRLLLISICLLVFAGTNAQQHSAKKSINLSAIDCKVVQTYSYITSGGKQIYNGPVSVKGGKTYDLEPYGHWGSVRGTTNYVLSATHNRGHLHGPISMKYTCNVKAGNDFSDVRNITYKGNFNKGMPNGNFSLNIKASYMETANIDVTYKNGIFTGPFRVKYQSWEWTDINGSFTKEGKMDGKWTISYKNRDEKSGEETYVFENGILVGGDYGPTDSKAKSLASKYANGKITTLELAKNGYYIAQDKFCIYSNRYDLYRFVAEKLFGWDYINYNELGGVYWHANNVKEGYEYLALVPFFTKEGFDGYVTSLLKSGWPIKPYEIVNLNNICRYNETLGLNYVEEHSFNTGNPIYGHIGSAWRTRENIYGYFLTDEQLEEFKSAIEQHNVEADTIFEELFKKNVLAKFQVGSRIEIARNQYYDVLSCRVVKYHNRHDGMTAEIDCRRCDSNDRRFETYTCNIKATEDDPSFFVSQFTQIRNKWDDVADIKKLVDAENQNINNVANKLIEEKRANLYAEWEKQRKAYNDFKLSNQNIAESHKDVNIVYDIYNRLYKVATGHTRFLELYTEAVIAKDSLMAESITEYVETTIPAPADWSEEYDIAALERVIKEQKELLSQWEIYKTRKKQIEASHAYITTENIASEVVIDEYLSAYNTTVKLPIKESIERFNKIIEQQDALLQYWPTYKELKQKAIDNHNQIVSENIAGSVVIGDYLSMYGEKVKLTIDEATKRYERIIALQDELLQLWPTFKELKRKATDNHATITSESIASEVIISDYTTLHNDRTKRQIADAINHYSQIVEVQRLLLQQWEYFIELKNKSTNNHNHIVSENVGADVVISSYLSAYGNKTKLTIDKASQRYEHIIALQDELLKQWPNYKELKKRATENNDTIVSENIATDVVITDYLTAYGDKTKLVVEEASKRYERIIAMQESLLSQWPNYKELKKKATENNDTIVSENIATDVVITDYLTAYGDKTKLVVEEASKRYERIIAMQENLLSQWPNYKELKKKATENHTTITNENLVSEVVISDYLALYNDKTRYQISDGSKHLSQIIEAQSTILEQWHTYKGLRKSATDNHTTITNENIASEVVIVDYLTLYNDKTKRLIPEASNHLSQIIAMQESLLGLWGTYKDLKRQSIDKHATITSENVASEVIINDYLTLYNARYKGTVEDSIKRTNEIIAQQDNLLKLWGVYKDLKKSAIDTHSYIINENVAADVAITNYLHLYEENAKTKVIVEVGIKKYNDVIASQEHILAHWPSYKKLRDEANTNHNKISNENLASEVVIDSYIGSYDNIAKSKLSIEESIKRYENIIKMQSGMLEQWPIYKELKQQAISKHNTITTDNMAAEVIIDDYLGLYNSKTKRTLEEGISSYRNITALQDYLLGLWSTYKSAKHIAIDKHNNICNENIVAEVVIDDYFTLYNNTIKTKVIVEESIRYFNDIIALQEYILRQWPLYKGLKEKATNKHDQIVATNMVAEINADEYLNLYNDKTRLSIEESCKRFNTIENMQQHLLSQWPTFVELRTKATDNNSTITDENIALDVDIEEYLTAYGDKTKLVVEEASKRYERIITMQESLLKQWPNYKELKKKATENNDTIVSENIATDVIITDYLTAYGDKTKLVVEEASKRYERIIAMQENLLKQWPNYKELKKKATENNDTIVSENIATDVVITDYLTAYGDKTKLVVDKASQRYERIITMQESLLSQWPNYKELKKKATENNDTIVSENIATDVVITDYLTAYGDKTKLVVEEASKRYERIIAMQENLLSQWPTFKELKRSIIENHSSIVGENVSSIVVITDYMNSYNHRSKSNIEESIKKVSAIKEQQTKLLELWAIYKGLNKRANDNHSQIRRENIASEVVIDEYFDMYENNLKGKVRIEVGITKLNSIVGYQDNLLSQWPIFKELSAKATENHRTIVAQKMSDEISIEGYVSTYENKTKIRLSIEESIKRLNNINEWQDTLLKQWAEFKQLKQQAIDLHAQIMATKSTVIKEYVALYNQVIKSKIAVESGIAAFKKLIKTQNEVIDYIALVAKISANHETLTNALKSSKVASKVYQSYFKTIDLTWHEGGNMFDVANKVLSNQAELLKHHKQLSHEQENRLKKMKYDSIEEFIKIYKRL